MQSKVSQVVVCKVGLSWKTIPLVSVVSTGIKFSRSDFIGILVWGLEIECVAGIGAAVATLKHTQNTRTVSKEIVVWL